MKKMILIAGMLSALVFTSCKKDKDKDNNNGGDNGVTKLIKKMTKTENGKTIVYNFTYDANKRLQGYATADNKEYVKFTYDNNGNVTGVEDLEEDAKNIYVYTYTNNKPVSATFKSWEVVNGTVGDLTEENELIYTITGDKVTKMELYMPEFDESLYMDLSYTDGNLTKIASSEGSAFTYTATFTFGNKKSPFPQLSKYVLDQAGFSLLFTSKNEVKVMDFDFPGTQLDNKVTTTYTYDNAGYPLTSDDGDIKFVYEYQ